jgi:hypothetical protein
MRTACLKLSQKSLTNAIPILEPDLEILDGRASEPRAQGERKCSVGAFFSLLLALRDQWTARRVALKVETARVQFRSMASDRFFSRNQQ